MTSDDMPNEPDEHDDAVEGINESLKDYMVRVGVLSSSERIRVHREFIDDKGNVIVKPSVVFAVDSEGAPHDLIDTDGYLKGKSQERGAVQIVKGVFTKSAPTGSGYIQIIAGADDTLTLLRGKVVIGGASAVPGLLTVQFSDSAGELDAIALEVSVAISEYYSLPAIAQVGANKNVADFGDFKSKTLHDRIRITQTSMADTESFSASIVFWSSTNTTPTVSATGGVWA
jgi:hypothetical protein